MLSPLPLICRRGDQTGAPSSLIPHPSSSSSFTDHTSRPHQRRHQDTAQAHDPPEGAPRGDHHMEPAVLIFLLYVMIAHELVCGWMQYRKQSGRARARTGPPPSSRARVCPGVWRASSQSQRSDRVRELRKSGRIVRKA